VISVQGDEADSMHFILDGRVAVIVELRDGRACACAASASTARSARWA
jgi:hypothetical protein